MDAERSAQPAASEVLGELSNRGVPLQRFVPPKPATPSRGAVRGPRRKRVQTEPAIVPKQNELCLQDVDEATSDTEDFHRFPRVAFAKEPAVGGPADDAGLRLLLAIPSFSGFARPRQQTPVRELPALTQVAWSGSNSPSSVASGNTSPRSGASLRAQQYRWTTASPALHPPAAQPEDFGKLFQEDFSKKPECWALALPSTARARSVDASLFELDVDTRLQYDSANMPSVARRRGPGSVSPRKRQYRHPAPMADPEEANAKPVPGRPRRVRRMPGKGDVPPDEAESWPPSSSAGRGPRPEDAAGSWPPSSSAGGLEKEEHMSFPMNMRTKPRGHPEDLELNGGPGPQTPIPPKLDFEQRLENLVVAKKKMDAAKLLPPSSSAGFMEDDGSPTNSNMAMDINCGSGLQTAISPRLDFQSRGPRRPRRQDKSCFISTSTCASSSLGTCAEEISASMSPVKLGSQTQNIEDFVVTPRRKPRHCLPLVACEAPTVQTS